MYRSHFVKLGFNKSGQQHKCNQQEDIRTPDSGGHDNHFNSYKLQYLSTLSNSRKVGGVCFSARINWQTKQQTTKLKSSKCYRYNHTSKMCKFSRFIFLPLKISQFATKLKKKIEIKKAKQRNTQKLKRKHSKKKVNQQTHVCGWHIWILPFYFHFTAFHIQWYPFFLLW